MSYQPIVEELIALLRVKPPFLKQALKVSLVKADWDGITSLPLYYNALDEMVTLIPAQGHVLPSILEFYYLIDHSDVLKTDPDFINWIIKFANEWGSFLDTGESARNLETFYKDPQYRIDDYFVAPGGWMSYNQFFARELKPGKRPIAGLCDDKVIVSPADSNYAGAWPIEKNSTVTVKNNTFSITELLEGSPYQDEFDGGIFTHSFLNVYDYHRFHVPVRGTVKETNYIRGVTMIDVAKDSDGKLVHNSGGGYQVHMMRGLIVLESPVGLVAVVPVGMDQVSSLILTPDVGAELAKGQECGFFQFGGSDIVTLYQANKVKLTATPKHHYLQGQQLGHVL